MVRLQMPQFCATVTRIRTGDHGVHSRRKPSRSVEPPDLRLGCEQPSLIVANSGLWDLESFWFHDGNRSKDFQIRAEHVERYVAGVKRLVSTLRATFPKSRIVWRTAHPAGPQRHGSLGFSHVVQQQAMHALNEGVRAFAPSWNLELFDTGRMLQGLIPTGILSRQSTIGGVGLWDGLHLNPWIHVPLINIMLNVLSETHGLEF